MMKVLLVLLLVVSFNIDAQELKKTKIEGELTIGIPDNMLPLTEEQALQRYDSFRKPMAYYSDYDLVVDFAVNRSYSTWTDNDLAMLQNFYRSSLNELFDEIEFIQDSITTVKGKDFVVFEMIYVLKPGPTDLNRQTLSKYAYLAYTVHKGQTYVFNFSCPKRLQEKWQGLANQMMSSIKLK